MVALPLVAARIESGRSLLKELANRKYPVTVAYWAFRDESSSWRLFIATPLAREDGGLTAYTRLQDALMTLMSDSTFAFQPIGLHEITVLDSEDEAPRAIATFAAATVGKGDVTLTHSVANGTYIDNAYIYRTEAA
jgi:hypothetical protein